jgi:hypothetical protein
MVERYGFTIYNDASGGMEPDVNGDYVRHDDYRELVSKLDAITRRAEAAEGDWQHMEEQYQSARKQLDSVTGNLQEAQSRLGRLIGPNEIANAAEARKVGMKRVVMSVPVDLIEEIGGVVERHEHKLVDPSNEVVESGGWRVCVECGWLQKPQGE